MKKKLILFVTSKWDVIILCLLILLYISILATLSVNRHNAFASRFDLSNMDQTLWYTLNGHFFSFRFPEAFVSRFAVHADLILILLSPLYLIWNDVQALIIAESFFLGLGAIPTYFLARKVLENKSISLTIVIAYLLNPGMQWTDIYDFHGVSLAIPFLLSAFYFAYVKKWNWYFIFTFLALLTKEQISLSIAVLGIFVFFIFKQKTIGCITFLTGILWFFLMVYIVIPHFSLSGTHWALETLGEKGTNPSNLLTHYFNTTTIQNTFIFNTEAIQYYTLLLKPFAFIPLLGFPWLLLAVPELTINILRGTTTIQFHYDSGIVPSLVIATIFGMYYVKIIASKLPILTNYSQLLLYLMAFSLLIIAIRVNYHYSPLPTTPSCWCRIYTVTTEDKTFKSLLQQIPKSASVSTSLEIRPHVSHRDLAFTVPSATQSAEYIALITQNRIPGDFSDKEYEKKLIPILLSSPSHTLLYRSQHFYLFKKITH